MTEVRRTKSPIRTDGALSFLCKHCNILYQPDPHGWGSFYPVRIFRAFSQARSARMGLFLIDGMSGTAAPL